jgi:hypothetical protein
MTNETEGFQPSSGTLNWTSTYGSFIFHHELRFSHPIFVSSNWSQHIRSLVNFITYLEPPYLLDYNYIIVPLPTGFFVSAYLNGEGVQEILTACWSSKMGTRKGDKQVNYSHRLAQTKQQVGQHVVGALLVHGRTTGKHGLTRFTMAPTWGKPPPSPL